jgi:DNA polymerase-1
VVISTGDKDLTQLVRPGVRWVNTMSEEVLDEAGVEAKFGVPPERIVDYLALVGDTVDNVPGVEKCGPKTAVKWLTEYGTLDNLVANADKVGGKVGENLRKHLDFLPLGRKLVTVAPTCELPVGLGRAARARRRQGGAAALYERFEFKGWLKDLDGGAASVAPATASTRAALRRPEMRSPSRAISGQGEEKPRLRPYRRPPQRDESLTPVYRLGELRRLAGEDLRRRTHRLRHRNHQPRPDGGALVGMSFATTGRGRLPAAGAPLRRRAGAVAAGRGARQAQALAGIRRPRQARPEPQVRRPRARQPRHRWRGIAHDTLLQSYVLEATSRTTWIRSPSATWACDHHLHEVCGKGAKQIGFDEVGVDPRHRIRRRGRRRHPAPAPAPVAAARGRRSSPRSTATSSCRCWVLQRMERTGVLIDPFLLSQQSEELGRRLHALEGEAHTLAGQPFNLGSPKQLGEILFGKLGLPVVKKTATGQPSTDEEVLEKLAEDYPLPKLLLEHRSLSKLKSTYTDKLPRMVNPRTGRVHTSFSQATAVTGRLASRAQPAEHPDPHAEGPPHPRRLHRAAGPAHRLGRLLADRAAHHGPPVGRRPPARSLRPRRGRAPRHRRRDLRRGAGRGQQRAAPLRQGDQLRPDLRHERARPGQEPRHRARRRAGYIDRYFARYPGVAATWSAPAPRRASRATSRPCSAAACTCPTSAPARPAAARAPSARRSTRRCRARPPT